MTGDRKVHLAAALERLTEYWAPETVARVNDYAVRAVKLHGTYHWHRHPDTDELFLCLKGGFVVQIREPGAAVREVVLTADELYVVPRGVEHRPIAHEEAHVLLIEPAATDPKGSPG